MSTQQLPYFYEAEISPDRSLFTLSEPTSKHCVQVLRMQKGEKLLLTNGQGLLMTAMITLAHKKHAQVKISDSFVHPLPAEAVSVVMAPTKNNSRTQWALEKLTEIGVTEIVLISTRRTERTAINPERLQQILIAAMLQSRQVYFPRLTGLIKFEDFMNTPRSATHQWVAHCLETGNKKTLRPARPGESHVILVGPEGDFTPEEIELTLKKGFEPVTLGKTRLRTETAALAAGVLLKI